MSTTTEARARSREYHLIYCRLLRGARERTRVSHSEVLSLAGAFTSNPDDAPDAGAILAQIAADEHAAGRPLLPALAVTGKDIPGNAFFAAARALGRLQGTDGPSEMRFWDAEERAVYDAWRQG